MKLGDLIEDLKSTSRPLEKEDILLEYESPFLLELIRRTFQPFLVYHAKIDEYEFPVPGNKDISELESRVFRVLDFCAGSKSPKKNKERILSLMERLDYGSQLLLWGVVSKNWRCGFSTKGVMKLYPTLFEIFEVQNANPYDPGKIYPGNEWLWSYKLHGVRGLGLRTDNEWKIFSRKGMEIRTCDHLKPLLEEGYQKHGFTMSDGELYVHGYRFEKILGKVRAWKDPKGGADLAYHLFITGSAESFRSGGLEDFKVFDKSQQWSDQIIPWNNGIVTPKDFDRITDDAMSKGYEGVCLRDPTQLYDYCYSDRLLKIKPMDTTPALVLGVIKDNFPIIENGEQVEEYLVTKLVVQQPDGIVTKVGTGFKLPFRREMTQDSSIIIGKTIEVQHEGYGSKGSFIIPVYKGTRWEGDK